MPRITNNTVIPPIKVKIAESPLAYRLLCGFGKTRHGLAITKSVQHPTQESKMIKCPPKNSQRTGVTFADQKPDDILGQITRRRIFSVDDAFLSAPGWLARR